MLPYRGSRFSAIAIGAFFVVAVLYALFEARGMVLGPTITLQNGVSETHEQMVVIQGRADRISTLLMDGNPISVSENGDFSQPYLLAPGYNRIVLDAKDRYGRGRQQVIEIMYTKATSTPSEASPTSTLETSLGHTSVGEPSTTTLAP